jgi:PmbA protein
LKDIDLAALAHRAAARADRMAGGGALPAAALASGTYDCVLSARVVCNIMNTAWQVFVGASMAAGKTIFAAQPGTPVGSDCLNILDAPRVDGFGYDFALDSEGTVCRSKAIVQAGRLVTPLHTLASAAALGHAPTGNAGRAALLTGSVPVSIVTIPAICYVGPGDSSEAALLNRLGDGLYVADSLDVFHSINITSGDFSIPCSGIVYRGGRAAQVANAFTLVGNLRDLFARVEAVGDDLQLEAFLYDNYAFGGPSMLVRGLGVSSAG